MFFSLSSPLNWQLFLTVFGVFGQQSFELAVLCLKIGIFIPFYAFFLKNQNKLTENERSPFLSKSTYSTTRAFPLQLWSPTKNLHIHMQIRFSIKDALFIKGLQPRFSAPRDRSPKFSLLSAVPGIGIQWSPLGGSVSAFSPGEPRFCLSAVPELCSGLRVPFPCLA